MDQISLGISWEKELLETVRRFSVLYEYHKGLKVKDTMKNAWDGIATALEFILELSHSFGLIH